MTRRTALIVIAVAGLLSACSDDSSSSGGAGTPLANGSEVADSPAPVPTDGGSAAPGGAIDCAAVTDAMGYAVVNIQVVAQLGSQPDVTQWMTGVGTMSEFENQLNVLSALEPYDDGVADAIAYYRGANEIAQRGFAGDTAAPAELTAYIGSDIADVLAKKVSFGIASDAAGC